jgi:CheY-like chemotaxis protein
MRSSALFHRASTSSTDQPCRTVREWEDLLDWQENHRRRRRPVRVRKVLLALGGLLFGWALRRTLRQRAWRRDRGRRLPLMQTARRDVAAREQPAPTPTPCAPASAPAPIPHPSSRPTVLVIDDDKTARKTISTILAKAAFEVSEAGTVAEALGRLAERPDWILLDLMLPDGSGCGVLREVTGQGSPSRVCVISGAGPTMIGEARSLGARQVLSKPLDVPRLMSILAT